ncbi:MAG: aminotransferase class I/II-fold pyridoxal phosphate-dependent enzyme [Nanoarchaeota archaeon]
MEPTAIELNEIIKSNNKSVYNMLSSKGKAIFFPKKGILAQAAEAKGKDINATIGIALEDDGTPMRLRSIEKNINLDPKDVFPYAPSFGKPDIRQKWKTMLFEKNPGLKGKEISLPIVTNALTHGLSIIGYLFIDENDKIIMPDLFWGNYKLIFINAYGAKLDLFKTFENGFNIEGLKEKLNQEGDRKIVLLNFPNNPTGYTPTVQEIMEIKTVIKDAAEKGKKIVVIIDDAYFGLVYKEGVYKESIFSELADLHENLLAVKVDGPTKEDYVWGLRVGFLTYGIKNGSSKLYESLASKTAGAVRGNISNDSNLSQSLVHNAYSELTYQSEKQAKYQILKDRFLEVQKVLAEHKEYEEEFVALPYNSGYFMCIQPNKDAEKIRQLLLEKYSTGLISVGQILRIAFSAVPKDQIAIMFKNIYKACKEI